jgi:DNA-binding NtrC family response regulator
MSKATVLVIDDEEEIRENIERLLASEGYNCRTLGDPTRFRQVRTEVNPDVLITDLRMPGADGMTILAAARADDPTLPVILITGFASLSSAVEAMQEGAFDYLAKPFTAEQLFAAVDRAARHRGLIVENQELKAQISHERFGTVAGSSAAFSRILDQVRRVAPTDANVLLTGESGTGKEIIARLLHDRSRRSKALFMPVDCAALPDGLMESELFGHERGAFTGAITRRQGLFKEADGGTIFLDEIGEMSMPMQSKLLRALEQREVRPVGGSSLVDFNVRVVAATNVDLESAVADGAFREDLYYRLNVVQLRLPPLRERRDDLPVLSSLFLKEAASAAGREVPMITPEAWSLLERYPWPGNIRELRNVMHRMVALDADGHIRMSDLPSQLRRGDVRARSNGNGAGHLPLDYNQAKEEATYRFMLDYLDQLLDAHDGNVSQAARTAGVSRRTLHRWLAEYREGNGSTHVAE